MSELIRREDCYLFAPSLGTDEAIWDWIYECQMPDSEEIYNFARIVLEKAQAVIDTAPTVTTDEVLAYQCPECRVVSMLYDPENEHCCPNCGIARKEYRYE